MKSSKNYLFILVALTFISLQSFAQDEQPPREKWSLETIQGTVNTINKETREITLIGSLGELIAFTASDAVERFDEIEVNDIVTFESWSYMLAEFRAPTAEEIAEPLVMIAEGGKAPAGMAPSAVVGAVMRGVVTIEALNRPYMIATVKGPRGNYVTIPMEDAKFMTKLHIGQVVILTYAEAVAVSLEKVGAIDIDKK
jgi:hypothetical protein